MKDKDGFSMFLKNCPINQCTADNISVGRCWHYMPDGHTCRIHGDVTEAVKRYAATRALTPERLYRKQESEGFTP